MKIYAVIPVHNRLDSTKQCVEDLLHQQFEGDLEVVVIDDGSTDGTKEYLESVRSLTLGQPRCVSTIRGDGTWWWSRCINVALSEIRTHLSEGDGVLLLNDDVRLQRTYITALIKVWDFNQDSVVMSQLVNSEDHSDLIDSPIEVDAIRLSVQAKASVEASQKNFSQSDAAPGRGTLYPAGPLIQGLQTDEKRLPHYLADYEFSIRVMRTGCPIHCAHDARVFTTKDWGNTRTNGGLYWRLFAKESPDRLIAYWQFWRTASPELSALLLTLRLFRYRIAPQLVEVARKWMK